MYRFPYDDEDNDGHWSVNHDVDNFDDNDDDDDDDDDDHDDDDDDDDDDEHDDHDDDGKALTENVRIELLGKRWFWP